MTQQELDAVNELIDWRIAKFFSDRGLPGNEWPAETIEKNIKDINEDILE